MGVFSRHLRHLAWRKVCTLLGALAACLVVVFAWAAGLGAAMPQSGLRLSPEESAWVAQHPVLRVGLSPDFPPFYMRDPASAEVHGFVVELLALWSQRSGLRFDIQLYPRQEVAQQALLRGEIDLIPFTALSPGAAAGLVATRPAFASNLVLAARRDVPDVSPTGNFGGRRVAVEAGSSVDHWLARHHPDAALQRFDTAEAALRALAGGQADLFVGYQQVAVYHIERLLLANVELRRNLGPGAVPLGPAVRADARQLRSILDKAIAATAATDGLTLAARWLPVASTRVPLPAASAQLNEPESLWVQHHGRIRVGYDASFAPVTQRGPLGEFQGFGADMFRLVVEKAGLSIEQELGGSFAEAYARGQRGELDVVVGMARTAQRRADYDFVGPFLSMPSVLVTRSDEHQSVADTSDIGRRRLALLRDHFLLPELRLRHPGLAVVELDRQDQVLAAVAEGAADVGLGNLSVVNELIEQRFAGRVSVSGIVRNGDSELYFGVPRQHPELTRVLSRALDAVNDSEVAQLRARWLAREVPGGLSWRQVLQVGVPVVVVLGGLVLLLWLGKRRLARAHEAEVGARQLAEDSTAARARFLAYLSHELRGTLGAVSAGAELLEDRDDPAQRKRLVQAIGRSASGMLAMLEQTLRYEQSLQVDLTLHPARTDLSVWWPDTLSPARLAAEAKGLQLLEHWDGPWASVQLDPVRLQQVVQNVLNNAVKFTASGQIQVRGRLLPGDEAPQQLEIEVQDAGPGLSVADRATLFQPYAQGDQGRRARHGAGLGLAISTQIVQAMGGDIRVPERPAGEGACFVITVPAPPADPA
jgi:two-component system sensor histidine kinase EvgS